MTGLLQDRQRLTELSIAAERHALSLVGFCGHPDYLYLRDRHFAELIVRECAEVGLDSVEDDDDLDAFMKRVHNNSLKHFGVE